MLTKGSKEYKKAQMIANNLTRVANYQRYNNNHDFKLYYEPFCAFLQDIINAGGFAAQVATTVDATTDPYGFKIAKLSDKQSWILACSAVENNIESMLTNF